MENQISINSKRTAIPLEPSTHIYNRGTVIGEIQNVADVIKDTSDRYLHGKDPVVKTTDELTNRLIEVDAEVTPTQKEYMAKRDYIFTAKNFSKDLIVDALDARVTELEDAIQRAPLKGAAERNGNTLGNLLELTTLAQKELSGEMKSKNALNKVLDNIIKEEQDEVGYQTANATKTGMIHDRNGKAVAYQVLDRDQRRFAQNQIDRVNENFEKGRVRLQENMKTL